MACLNALFALICLLATACGSQAIYVSPREHWATRSILQVLTDRFALADCPTNPPRCKDLMNACGGNHIGLRQRLDYVQGMGFDAVWISPVTSQTGGPIFEQQDGWHGYWPKNMWDLNSMFGTPDDLTALVSAMHSRDMAVMLDIVPNHAGYFKEEDIHEMTFDKMEYYHSCRGCSRDTCNVTNHAKWLKDPPYVCRLQGLPDLNQKIPYVANTLHEWMAWIRDTYEIDAFRVDAAKHIYPFFLQEMKRRAGIFTIGESYQSEWYKGTLNLAKMVNSDQLDSQLSYALHMAAYHTFGTKFSNTTMLKEAVELTLSLMPKHAMLLGNFLDNHDRPRLANSTYINDDLKLNALTFVFFVPGIPIVYYGTEAGLIKSTAPLWETWNWDKGAPLYTVIKMLNWYRRSLRLWTRKYQTVYDDGLVYAFLRGDSALVILSSVAAKNNSHLLPRSFAVTGLPKGMRGLMLENIYDPQITVVVSASGTAEVQLDSLKPLVFVGRAVDPATFLPPPGRKWLVPFEYVVLLVTLAAMAVISLSLWLIMAPGYISRIFGSWFDGSLGRTSYLADQLPGNLVDDPEAAGGALHVDFGIRDAGRAYQDTPAVGSHCCGFQPAVLAEAKAALISLRYHGEVDVPGGKVVMKSKASFKRASQQKQQELERAKDVGGRRSPTDQYSEGGVKECQQQQGGGRSSVEKQQQQQQLSQWQPQHLEQLVAKSDAPRLRRGELDSAYGSSSALTKLPRGDCSSLAPQTSAGSVDSSTGCSSNTRGGTSCLSDLRFIFEGPTQQDPRKGSAARAQPLRSSAASLAAAAAAAAREAGNYKACDLPSTSAHTTSMTPTTSAACSLAPTESSIVTEGVMHVAMEYTIPYLGLDSEFVFGGLGKVVDTFIKEWPGDLVVCAPLYAGAYRGNDPSGPYFMTAPAALRFTVWAGHQSYEVEVYDLVIPSKPGGCSRRYFLLQADVFRYRSRSDIYTFSTEHDMITWLSVFNQAVAEVVVHWGVRRIQLHDYHGALALQYMPKKIRPQVLYIAHNAHYNGVFALPTRHRAAYLYSMFDLNPAAVSRYTEHKSSFDTLHSLMVHMTEAQRGIGCAAVSPKYASEIRTRLSPFWQMPPGSVVGITNGMDCAGTWAGEGLSVAQVEARKKEAKRLLQEMLKLHVGQQYQLAVFLGRLTHQKGADIIAEAAPQLLSRHKHLQLLVIGPLGDVAGADAQESLGALALSFPGRVCAPANHYVDGQDKQLIMAAADFCICPSRYEPCGLVDIEFGWYGGLIVGNATGGLGKMPGFYFSAGAATLPHLAAKLCVAFNRALSASPDQKRLLRTMALAKRFPMVEQMRAYTQLWNKIDEAFIAAEARQEDRFEVTSETQVFFAHSWRRRNLNLDPAAAPAPTAATLGHYIPTNSTVTHDHCPHGGTYYYGCGPGCTALPQPLHKTIKRRQKQQKQLGPRHSFSSHLLLLLQNLSLLPTLLLLAYMVLQQISRLTWSSCPLRPDDREWMPGLNHLGLRVMWYVLLSTGAAPVWTYLAFKKNPRSYIILVCSTTLASLLLVQLSFIWQASMNTVLLLVAPCSLSGLPLLALGFMGCQQELSEVGYQLMVISDMFKGLLLAGCAGLTILSTSRVPFLLTSAAASIATAALTTWMCLPGSLPPAYRHLKLNMCWREQRVLFTSGPKSLFLTLAISVLDVAALSLLGYLLSSLEGLYGMVVINGASFAAGIFGIMLAAGLLLSPCVQLHVHAITLLIAALPAAALLKGLAAWLLQPLWQVVVAAAGVEMLLGSRAPLSGFLALLTLPSREAVAVWQLLAVMLGNVVMLAVVAVVLVLQVAPGKLVLPLLLTLGGVELLRLVAGVALAKIHPKENLSAL